MDFDVDQGKIQLLKDGKTIDCDILFAFDCEETKKSYVGYTDHSVARNGRKNIYVSSYNPLKPKIDLENVTDERELKMIHDVLRQLDERVSD